MARPPPSSIPKPTPRASAKATQAVRPPPKAPASFSTWPRWKKFTVTGLFATVIVTGAIWGASLKMRREAQIEKLKVKEATTDEKIFLLEQRRQHLIKQKGEIDTKLSDLHKRMKVRESGLTTR